MQIVGRYVLQVLRRDIVQFCSTAGLLVVVMPSRRAIVNEVQLPIEHRLHTELSTTPHHRMSNWSKSFWPRESVRQFAFCLRDQLCEQNASTVKRAQISSQTSCSCFDISNAEIRIGSEGQGGPGLLATQYLQWSEFKVCTVPK